MDSNTERVLHTELRGEVRRGRRTATAASTLSVCVTRDVSKHGDTVPTPQEGSKNDSVTHSVRQGAFLLSFEARYMVHRLEGRHEFEMRHDIQWLY